MSAKLMKVNEKYVYFFTSYDEALTEANEFDDFVIYQFGEDELFIIGERDALFKKRPHFYDWNGALYPHNRLDSEKTIEWRLSFNSQLVLYTLSLESIAA